MRTFLHERNLLQAAGVSLAVTLLCLPRLLASTPRPLLMALAVFVLMAFPAGAGLAWGREAGLKGFWGETKRLGLNLGEALLVGVGLALLFRLVFDASMQARLQAAGAEQALQLSYPGGPAAILALACWAAGFESLFFQAGPIAVLARVTRRVPPAVVCAIALRLWIAGKQFQLNGLDAGDPLLYLGPLLGSAAACLLYVRGGWPAAALFGFVLPLRLLF